MTSPSIFFTNFRNVNIFLALWCGLSSTPFCVANNLEGSIFTYIEFSDILATSFVYSFYSKTIFLSFFIDIFIFDYDVIWSAAFFSKIGLFIYTLNSVKKLLSSEYVMSESSADFSEFAPNS